jgi:CBS domain-containing protein
MSEEVKIVSPDDTIQQAAKLMEQVDCGAIPVREKDRLVGVVTDRDIAIRAVATGARPDQCKVREVMSPGIKYVFEDETAESAAERMSEFQIRRLPVLNRSIWSASSPWAIWHLENALRLPGLWKGFPSRTALRWMLRQS